MTPEQTDDLPGWLGGERARPTLPALAGAAGALVVLVGTFLLLEEVDTDDLRLFGLALAAFTLLVGCVLMLVERRGALRTAGVALAAGAVVPLALTLVNDPAEIDSRTDALLTGLVAVVGWLVLFALSPARGHGLFIGLALLGAWFAAVSQTAPQTALFWLNPLTTSARATATTEPLEVPPPPSIVFPDPPSPPTFTIPTVPLMPERTFPESELRPPPVPLPEPRPVEPTFPFPTFPEPEEQEQQEQREQPQEAPQQTSLGGARLASTGQPVNERGEPPIAPAVVSIAVGLLYLAFAALLDRARLSRLAGAFVAVGLPVLALGVVFVGPRHGAVAVSVAAVAFGLVLLAVGVGGGRRFSGWTGAAVLAGGILGLVGEAFDDPGSGDAVAMLLVGGALVGAGWFLSQPVAGARPQPADQAAHDSSS
ncbi:MAG TPA: hypothetical protein VHF47_12480 [Acidimicrobiales bacterium]|nr:hypothetical protein [Acidimicrobiales bacterium]